MPLGGDPVATGQAKVGCFIGDHTRTGLGSMLNTGTAIGVMCNVLPAGPLLPKHVPSFAAVLYGRVAPGFPLEQMFATARIVMGRRGQAFTRSRSSSTSTSTSRPAWSASAPSRRPTTAAATPGPSDRHASDRPAEPRHGVLTRPLAISVPANPPASLRVRHPGVTAAHLRKSAGWLAHRIKMGRWAGRRVAPGRVRGRRGKGGKL